MVWSLLLDIKDVLYEVLNKHTLLELRGWKAWFRICKAEKSLNFLFKMACFGLFGEVNK